MQLSSIAVFAAMAINQGLLVSAGLVGHASDADGSFVSKRAVVYDGYCTKSSDAVAHGYCTFEGGNGKDQTIDCDGSYDCTETDNWCGYSPDGPVKVNCV
ncbi:hypothetical protein F4821DRAFT_260590 [Hypoxylon rubiginosum]|uniref:Uncharacterized protein n=1 Tax=Hypoxylon rubiginosum TaxID=110542 RepID=A0ACC0CZJ9_9PEZI|nr:hypothetical protein F4821DRAFT_260590 [Hypoxylon rubiginosum]